MLNINNLKPLEWKEPFEDGSIHAVSPFGGLYTIWPGSATPKCRVSLRNDHFMICDDMDDAKRVVNEHHVEKIKGLFECQSS